MHCSASWAESTFQPAWANPVQGVFPVPDHLEATYQIVTPMFIGGADQTPDDGIRPPTLKGALRFWWRALHWGECLREAQTEAAALQGLHQREARLFGLAADGAGSGQGCFLLQIKTETHQCVKANLPTAIAGHQYLLGQGLYHFKEQYLREAMGTGEMRVTLRFRPGTATDDRTSIAKAMLALGLLGGLGSRARKGFGALAIQSLEGCPLTVPTNADQTRACFETLITERLDALPPLTAFSAQTRIDLITAHTSDPWTLLGELGAEMQRYRSWGQNGQVAGAPAERNFPDDHDLAQRAAAGETVATHPRRALFGLPHNYYFSSTKDKLEINAVAPKREGGWSDLGTYRRASPLFLHPHQFPDGSMAAVIALLPAQFLPDDWRIGLKDKRAPMRRVDVKPDWRVIHRFMDRFAGRNTLLEARS